MVYIYVVYILRYVLEALLNLFIFSGLEYRAVCFYVC
jgi:hypothetical protein